ncbi:MAG: hypothetical protein N2316_04915 [Spirochaetes bacterium]|nr:hypothetical protein [Spirochaetota bacterium]
MKRVNLAILLLIIALIALSACSYSVDIVERAITKRASFSIVATRNSDGSITIQWNKTGGDNFAGYEIYITIEPDNEYIGYAVIGAPYAISTSNLFRVDSTLQYSIAQAFTMNSAHVSNLIASNGKGRYFFRVGIIAWDDDEDKRNGENGYIEPWYLHIEENYLINTHIDEISGSAMVDIY